MIGRFLGISLASTLSMASIFGMVLIIAMEFAGQDVMFRTLGPMFASAETLQPPPPAPVVPMVLDAPDALEPSVVAEQVRQATGLDEAEDITFFKVNDVDGTPFGVTTGVKFADVAALSNKLVGARWCYIRALAPDGVLRQIDLAMQEGSLDPIFESLADIPDKELSLFNMTAEALERLARSHCAFDFITPTAPDGGE